jgi:hypothetical protein
VGIGMGRNGKLSQGMGGNGNQIIHNAFVRNGNGNSSWEWEGMGMKKAFPATSKMEFVDSYKHLGHIITSRF